MPARKKIQTPPLARLLSTAQAVEATGYSARTLHRLADQRRLTKYYLGSRLRWDADELDALVSPKRPAAAEASAQRLRERRSEQVAS
jgi:predicted DNA-binding transcriptional regulator AlpA